MCNGDGRAIEQLRKALVGWDRAVQARALASRDELGRIEQLKVALSGEGAERTRQRSSRNIKYDCGLGGRGRPGRTGDER